MIDWHSGEVVEFHWLSGGYVNEILFAAYRCTKGYGPP